MGLEFKSHSGHRVDGQNALLTRDEIAARQVDSSICQLCGVRHSVGCNHGQRRPILSLRFG